MHLAASLHMLCTNDRIVHTLQICAHEADEAPVAGPAAAAPPAQQREADFAAPPSDATALPRDSHTPEGQAAAHGAVGKEAHEAHRNKVWDRGRQTLF